MALEDTFEFKGSGEKLIYVSPKSIQSQQERETVDEREEQCQIQKWNYPTEDGIG